MIVPVMVQGEGPFDFLVGPSPTHRHILISEALAERLLIDVEAEPETLQPAFGSDRDAYPCSVEHMKLGTLLVGPLEAAVSASLDEISRKTRHEFGGSFGLGLLDPYCVEIDFKKWTLSLRLSRRSGPSAMLEVIPGTSIIAVHVHANGVPLKFSLALGSSHALISQVAFERLGLFNNPSHYLVANGEHTATIDSLSVGGCEARSFKALIASPEVTSQAACNQKVDGVLGYDFLKDYQVTVDFPRRRLCLTY